MRIDCPLPTALASIPTDDCPFRMDQIVRFAFERRGGTGFASETAMKALATWTPKLTATDSTKIVMSPFFSGFVIPQSEALTVGGNDNSTFNGIAEYNGEGSVTASGVFKNMQPATKDAMEPLTQESLASAVGVSNLTVYMINKDGVIFYKNITTLKGVPIYNWRLSTRGSEGFNAPDTNGFSFNLASDWDKGWKSVVPNFDPLTELNN